VEENGPVAGLPSPFHTTSRAKSRSSACKGPTANKAFRQAVSYALDRDFARDVVWNGLGKPATFRSALALAGS
jgi:ABC-type transport system substrate-binding protein